MSEVWYRWDSAREQEKVHILVSKDLNNGEKYFFSTQIDQEFQNCLFREITHNLIFYIVVPAVTISERFVILNHDTEG